MMPGMCERRTHDYLRHGTTSLFAAFSAADGTVISSTHRGRGFSFHAATQLLLGVSVVVADPDQDR
jgi:hypothetical protein